MDMELESNYEIDNKIVESKLFSYIKPKQNNMVSKLKGLDLKEFLLLLDNYYLTLRKRLDFDEEVTFGLEIEFKRISGNISNYELSKILEEKIKNNLWNVKYDASLRVGGGEVNSPIMRDNLSSWIQLKQVCSVLKEHSYINEKCGGHIHVGTQILGCQKEIWLNFLKLWATYENIIYRFVYGEYLTERPEIETFAPLLAKKIFKNYSILKNKNTPLKEFCWVIGNFGYSAVSFKHIIDYNNFRKDNTIEFRCPNGTLEPVIWQNNVNFFVHLLNYCKNSDFDNYIIRKRRYHNLFVPSCIDSYNQIYLAQALELCDMIFDNNLDKIYFLRQYLKSFDVGQEPLEKAKTFILKK